MLADGRAVLGASTTEKAASLHLALCPPLLNGVLHQLCFPLRFISLPFTAGSVRVPILATWFSVSWCLLSCLASVEKWDCGTVTPEAHKSERHPWKHTSFSKNGQIDTNFWVLFQCKLLHKQLFL